MQKIIMITLLSLLLSGCAGSARLYNLETATITHLVFQDNGTGHGQVTGKLNGSTPMSGEFSTLSGGSSTWASANAFAQGSGGYAWANAQGFSTTTPNTNYGSATIVGGGIIIECLYGTSGFPSHGNGVCRDNKGGRYRLQF